MSAVSSRLVSGRLVTSHPTFIFDPPESGFSVPANSTDRLFISFLCSGLCVAAICNWHKYVKPLFWTRPEPILLSQGYVLLLPPPNYRKPRAEVRCGWTAGAGWAPRCPGNPALCLPFPTSLPRESNHNPCFTYRYGSVVPVLCMSSHLL